MAKTLIEIRAETTQYQQAMRQAAAEMKKLTSEHSLAAAQAKLNGSAQDAMRAKVTELTSKIGVQKDIVSKNSAQYDTLKQKLDLQKSAHDQLKTKVDAAKTAYEESAKATGKDSEETRKLEEEYGKLQTQLTTSENNINKTETAITRQEAAVTKSKAALAEMEAELKNVNAELARAPFDEYAEKAGKVGGTITKAGESLLPLTTGLVGLGATAVKITADFDQQMSKVSAISGATGGNFDSLRDKAREMGAKTKFSATESAEAMEYMAMAGWKTGDMLNGIEGIMNLAAASGEDLASTSDIVTDAMTAFGLSAEGTTKIVKDGFTKEVANATHFADVLAAASSNSNTNVSMLGESFKYAAPVAGSLGYSVEDTAVALGLMANSGIKASQGGTALRTMLTNLAKPTDTVAGAMKYLNISLSNNDGSMKSLKELMDDLRKSFGTCKMSTADFNAKLAELDAGLASGELTEKKYNKALKDLEEKAFGAEGALKANLAASIAGKEGMSGLLSIIAAAPEDYDKLTNAIYDCDGSAESMADTMQDNLAGQITTLMSQLQELAISFGDLLVPVISEVVGHIQDFVKKLNSMDEGQRQTILRIGLVVAALGPALIGIGKVITATGTISKALGKVAAGFANVGGVSGAFTKALGKVTAGFANVGGVSGVFTKALAAITSPAAIVVAAIAAITAVIVHLWNTNEDFRNTITGIWQKIKDAFTGFTEGIRERLSGLGISFSNVTSAISTVWNGFCNLLAPVIEAAFQIVATALQTAFDVILGIWDVFSALFNGDWSGAWDAAKGIFTSVFDAVKEYFSTVLDAIKGVLDVFLGWFGTNWETVWNAAKALFSEVWEAIKEGASIALDAIQTAITTVFTAIATVISTIWNGIKDFLSETWTAIKLAISLTIDAIATVIMTVFNAVATTINTVWNGIKTVTSTIWNGIKTAITTSLNTTRTTTISIVNGIRSTVSTVWNGIKTVTSTIWNGIKTAITTSLNTTRSTVSSVVNRIGTTVGNIWNRIKSTTENVWESIQNAIETPINTARDVVQDAINTIRGAFNFTWSLPHLALPHPYITGSFSINPPSVPHFGIDWYRNGAIMTKPTVFGANGNTLLAGGEAGDEAILPLKPFYDRLADILDKKLEAISTTQTVYVYVTLDGDTIASRVYTRVEDKMVDETKRRR